MDVSEFVNQNGGEGKVALMSNKYCQLQEISTCYRKNNDGTVGNQIECPKHIMEKRHNVKNHSCKKVFIEKSSKDDTCSFITKAMLEIMKS